MKLRAGEVGLWREVGGGGRKLCGDGLVNRVISRISARKLVWLGFWL